MKNKSEICRCLLFEAAVWSCCQVSIRSSLGIPACAICGQGPRLMSDRDGEMRHKCVCSPASTITVHGVHTLKQHAIIKYYSIFLVFYQIKCGTKSKIHLSWNSFVMKGNCCKHQVAAMKRVFVSVFYNSRSNCYHASWGVFFDLIDSCLYLQRTQQSRMVSFLLQSMKSPVCILIWIRGYVSKLKKRRDAKDAKF